MSSKARASARLQSLNPIEEEPASGSPSPPRANNKRSRHDDAEYQGVEPACRKQGGSTVAQGTKDQIVHDVDINHGACVLSMQEFAHIGIQSAHVLAQVTGDSILTRLEWAWGLLYYELFVDTYRNLVLLRSDLHTMFDAGRWALVPTSDMIQRILVWVIEQDEKGSQPCKYDFREDELFDFRVLAFPEMSGLTISRRRTEGNTGRNTVEHEYPYTGLDVVKSYIHPFFVVFNLGVKLKEWLEVDSNHDLYDIEDICGFPVDEMKAILHIYAIWMKEPPNSFSSRSFTPATNHANDSGGSDGPRIKRPCHNSRGHSVDEVKAAGLNARQVANER